MKFVIEHLEPELYEWCLIEYEHISGIVGKQNLIFTNVDGKEKNKLKKFGSVFEKSVSELSLKNICVLSQYSKNALRTDDKNKFKYFVFGGILGDNPAGKRTNAIIRSLKKSGIRFGARNLGKRQMPTDAAVYAAKEILDGKKLSSFKFVDNLEIEINESESVGLRFRYVVDKGKLIISQRLVDYLRKREEF
jgi:ribosome biogenesis SPOUT family RNA methylase Rps3